MLGPIEYCKLLHIYTRGRGSAEFPVSYYCQARLGS